MDKKKTSLYLKCKDHTVSGETFSLVWHEKYKMLCTDPAPDVKKLPDYYQSEDYISHTDSRRSLFEKMYHMVKHYALRQKLKYIVSGNQGHGKLLDIGAGTGDFLNVAKNNGWEVEGIEPSDAARRRSEEKGITLHEKTDPQFMETYESGFDVITMWHVLEHVPELQIQIGQLKALLRPNGTLFIAVPNFRSYDATHYGKFWAAYDVPRHLWHFSADAIKALFADNEMKVVRRIPMKFDAFYVSLLSEKYKTGKMNFLKAFWSGWRSNRKAAHSGEYSSIIYVIKHQNS
ncbi:Methyltransferase domain-containing protein [Sinomicrobium oceani]|uniref:Methyltransferase domain-containing protein n=1 Tax=Sinomicrobium oceani TaxID=1150368 RepID=A0A1K1QXV3_9FLAO|nr:class I SAM-dependent methyltransferase [Sinomicrobium oceani]SFW64613.1 Methyltransferase domain-containing protein [Sinomicrobium oceani]